MEALRLTNGTKEARHPEESIEIRGFITDQEKRKIGILNRSSILRFPAAWLNRLIEDGSNPFVEITRIIEPDGNWFILISRLEEEAPIG